MERDYDERRDPEGEIAAERAEVAADEPIAPAGVRAARGRFGGIDLPASLGGMFAAFGFLVLLAGLVAAAIGGFGYQMNVAGVEQEVTVGGLIAGFITLFVAFLFGGWVAGRMARYDGLINGLALVVLAVLVAALFGLLGYWLGEQYNVFAQVNLPAWFTEAATTTAAVATGVGALVAMLLGALLGGWLGERYHRSVDYAVAEAQEGYIRERAGFFGSSRRRGFRGYAAGEESRRVPSDPAEREEFCREVCPC
jgi:hypothetical protein